MSEKDRNTWEVFNSKTERNRQIIERQREGEWQVRIIHTSSLEIKFSYDEKRNPQSSYLLIADKYPLRWAW